MTLNFVKKRAYGVVNPPREEFTRLYYEKRLRMVDLARHYGVSTWTIGRWVNLFELEKRPTVMPPWRSDVTPKTVARLYVDEKKSTHTIARELSCSPCLINRRLREAGVKLRHGREALVQLEESDND